MSTWLSTSKKDRRYENLLPRPLAEESISSMMEPTQVAAMKMGASKPRSSMMDIVCHHCKLEGHMKRDCRKLKKEQKEEEEKKNRTNEAQTTGKCYATMARTGPGERRTWLLDSGASFHMTGIRDWIQGYRSHSFNKDLLGNR